MKNKKPELSDEELKELMPILQKLLPKATEFRPHQKPIIKQIISGQDTLAIMPTGGGKSACYQVPALYFSERFGGITLVISPLRALMEDQVRKLAKSGVKVACICSSFIRDNYPPKNDVFHRFKDANAGDEYGESESASFRSVRNRLFKDAVNGEYSIIYVTPERLRNGAFINFAQRAKIKMIAVDEAHCISLWGYDFRPRYLEISRFLKRIGYHPIIAAFTATTTKSSNEDIIKKLDMHNCRIIENDRGGRGNLDFRIRCKDPENRDMLEYLQKHKDESGFVYCSTVKNVNEVYDLLKEKGISVTRYYAGLDEDYEVEKDKNETKEKNFDDFIKGRKQVMVSTTALGMGIDKDDVRFVIHYNLPLCLENYYQEAGRAGRDGKAADCILYYSAADIPVCKSLIDSSLRDSELSEQDNEKRRIIAEERLECMIEYGERGQKLGDKDKENSKILQKEILSYFKNYEPILYRIKKLELSIRCRRSKNGDLLKYLQEREGESGLIYCSNEKKANEVYGYLKGKGISVTRCYTEPDEAPKAEKEKSESADDYLDDLINVSKVNRYKLLVSGTAPGFGYKRSDIRFIIHYNLPFSLEEYYRETACVGYSGNKTECILYYTEKDVSVCRNRIAKAFNNETISESECEKRKGLAKERLEDMIRYAELGEAADSKALKKEIVHYFKDLDVVSRIDNIDVLYCNRTKIAHELRKGVMANKALAVNNSHKKGATHNGPKATVSYEVRGEEALNYFDMMVADAVYTLIKHRVAKIYAKNVMELLAGNEKLLLRPERTELVKKSIRKMMKTEIMIDRRRSAFLGFTYKGQENKFKNPNEFLPFLPLKEIEEKKNVYFVSECGKIPPLYEYAEIMNGQFFSFPIRYLNLESISFQSSNENLMMVHYLLCRIDMMAKYDKREKARNKKEKVQNKRTVTSSTIRFDTVMKTIRVEDVKPVKEAKAYLDKKYYQNRRADAQWNRMLQILEHLKNVHFIESYEAKEADFDKSRRIKIKRFTQDFL